MDRNENLYAIESDKSVSPFVINNLDTIDMKTTFHQHGGAVPADFDLHMIQVCKPTKADKSLTYNQERAILMPKFIHVFSKDARTHIRYVRFGPEQISAMVPDDPQFPESLTHSFNQICTMIDEAK